MKEINSLLSKEVESIVKVSSRSTVWDIFYIFFSSAFASAVVIKLVGDIMDVGFCSCVWWIEEESQQ